MKPPYSMDTFWKDFNTDAVHVKFNDGEIEVISRVEIAEQYTTSGINGLACRHRVRREARVARSADWLENYWSATADALYVRSWTRP